MMMKKLLVIISVLSIISVLLTGCGDQSDVLKIGVTQIAKHDALDASYQGFVDVLEEAGYIDGENIEIDYQNAQGDQATANTIAMKLVNDNSDLILAIGTPAAQAVANATRDIPILVTAVTDPAASGLVDSNEKPGGNVSGTSDMTPVKKQIELLTQLVPDATNIAILYTSSESNSKIQADLAIEAAQEYGIDAQEATISNSNEIQQVVQSLVGKVDAIYIPTDNVIADGMPTVAMVTNANNIPTICGEEGMLDSGGLATYGINYYELGRMTGEQAIKILEESGETETMPIGYLPEETYELKINEELAAEMEIIIPEGLLDN